MSTENTTEAAPTAPTNEMPSPTQETPNSTVENLPQEGDFASWLSDRLDKFEKGTETAPWEQKQTTSDEESESSEEAKTEATTEKETPTLDETESKETAEDSKEDTDESDVDIKTMSTAAGAKFKELKTELKEYKTRVAALEKAATDAKTAPQSTEQFEKLQAQVSEYEQELAVTKIEATAEFKRAVLEPTQAILDTAAAMAERYKINTSKLINALREESLVEGSDALTELAGDFSERDRVRLYRMSDDLSDVSRRRDYLRENASRAYAEQQEQHKAEESKQEQAYKLEVKKAAEQAWNETFAGNPVLNSLDKSALAEIHSVGAEADLLDSSALERAYAVYAGAALPHVVKQYEAATAKVTELENALSKYKKASPKASGSADTSPAPSTDEGGFLDALEKRFTNG